MIEKILKKDNLISYFEKFSKKKDSSTFDRDILIKGADYVLWMPVTKGANTLFAPIEDVSQIVIKEDFTNSRVSPKNIFLPQSEILMTYDKNGDDANIYKAVKEEPLRRIVFGIRPCDAKAFTVIDKIYKNDKYTDNYWFDKREKTILIGLGCNEPCSTCFCTSVNSHPFGEAGLDIIATDLGDRYIFKALTIKGESIIAKSHDCLDITDQDVKERQQKISTAESMIDRKIDLKNIDKKSVLEIFNETYWDDISQTCLNCNTCAYVCPTCHCFDIQDEQFKDQGVRVRNWDACMSYLFTEHTTGHNPRPAKKERFRQRFMHKAKYIPLKRDNEYGCVGCGRCITSCPSNVDIRDVFTLMNKEGVK